MIWLISLHLINSSSVSFFWCDLFYSIFQLNVDHWDVAFLSHEHFLRLMFIILLVSFNHFEYSVKCYETSRMRLFNELRKYNFWDHVYKISIRLNSFIVLLTSRKRVRYQFVFERRLLNRRTSEFLIWDVLYDVIFIRQSFFCISISCL